MVSKASLPLPIRWAWEMRYYLLIHRILLRKILWDYSLWSMWITIIKHGLIRMVRFGMPITWRIMRTIGWSPLLWNWRKAICMNFHSIHMCWALVPRKRWKSRWERLPRSRRWIPSLWKSALIPIRERRPRPRLSQSCPMPTVRITSDSMR